MVMKVTESDESHREELMALRLPIRLTQSELSDLASKIEKLQSSEARHNLPDHFSDKQSIAFANARIFLRIYGRRDSSFPLGNFADPGWQLLVDLFVHQASGKQVNVSSACIGSRAPSTTAKRSGPRARDPRAAESVGLAFHHGNGGEAGRERNDDSAGPCGFGEEHGCASHTWRGRDSGANGF